MNLLGLKILSVILKFFTNFIYDYITVFATSYLNSCFLSMGLLYDYTIEF